MSLLLLMVLPLLLSTIPAHRANRSLPVILYPHPLPTSSKNKLQNRGIFLALEKHQPTHHDLPATHHKLTTKKPRSAHHFSQKPLQKPLSTSLRKKSLP
jgi:hypothetical protein